VTFLRVMSVRPFRRVFPFLTMIMLTDQVFKTGSNPLLTGMNEMLEPCHIISFG
jgi:hypothetical protein